MSGERSWNAAVVSITVAVLATGIHLLAREETLFERTLGIVLTVLAGAGTYELVTRVVELSLRHSPPFKRFLLGSSYVEGKWVGFYIGLGGRPRFVIQVIRQSWAKLTISGRALNEMGRPHGQWRSQSAVVDGDAGLLHAILTGELDGGHYDSLITLQLEGTPPSRMFGYISDNVANVNAGRVWIEHQRVADTTSDEEALHSAQALFGRANALETIAPGQ